MGSAFHTDHEKVYISCLTYLAAEAEREGKHMISQILKSATSDIYEWTHHGTDIGVDITDDFAESITAAFLVILQHKALSLDKKKRMVELFSAMETMTYH